MPPGLVGNPPYCLSMNSFEASRLPSIPDASNLVTVGFHIWDSNPIVRGARWLSG